MQSLAVFGLGYVGREIASLALNRGMDVYGVDDDSAVIAALESKQPFHGAPGTFYPSTAEEDAVSPAEAIMVAVPTPLLSSYEVDLSPLRSVCQSIAEALTPSDSPLPIIIESTIPPGTISDVIVPIFKKENLVVGDDIFLAHVPERIDPNNDDWPLEDIPRVIGGMTPEGTRTVAEIYTQLLDAEVYEVGSTSVAAAAKIIENAYRDINIAFVNEIALTLDQLNLDVKEALDAAATKPFGFTRFSPGAGVGGHCIPIDPYFLMEKARYNGSNNRFLKSARSTNDYMPKYVAQKTIRTLVQEGTLPQDTTVLLLGKAFKPDVEDSRNSPYHTIYSELASYDMTIETYDPYLPDESTVNSEYSSADTVILVTAHQQFRNLSFDRLAQNGVNLFVDGRNIYNPEQTEAADIKYIGVGR